MSLIDPQLAAILVCPVDKADLTEDEDGLAAGLLGVWPQIPGP